MADDAQYWLHYPDSATGTPVVSIAKPLSDCERAQQRIHNLQNYASNAAAQGIEVRAAVCL